MQIHICNKYFLGSLSSYRDVGTGKLLQANRNIVGTMIFWHSQYNSSLLLFKLCFIYFVDGHLSNMLVILFRPPSTTVCGYLVRKNTTIATLTVIPHSEGEHTTNASKNCDAIDIGSRVQKMSVQNLEACSYSTIEIVLRELIYTNCN